MDGAVDTEEPTDLASSSTFALPPLPPPAPLPPPLPPLPAFGSEASHPCHLCHSSYPRVDEPALGFFMPSPVIVTLFAVPFLSLLRVDEPALGFFIPSPIIVSLVTDGRAVLGKVASLTAVVATAHVFFGCRTIFCKVASLTAIIATALVFFGFNLFFGRLSLPHQRADEFFGVVFVTDEARHFVIVCHCWSAQCN